MTGALLRIDIKGRNGEPLRDAWAAGPRTYLGLGVVGFPNLFTITGPGSPSVLTNMMVSIQQHVDWIGDCLAYLRDNNLTTIEATQPAQDKWVEYVNTVAAFTLFPTCNSWYLGANVPGKTRVFMPLLGYPPYEEKCTTSPTTTTRVSRSPELALYIRLKLMRRVALLRGVNVGGHGKVAMPALKAVFEEVGAKNVVTYIQSGNVVFDGPAALNAKKLEHAIEKHFKLNVSVAVRTHAQLKKVIDGCPYDDPSLVHVGFLVAKPKTTDIDVSQFAPEELTVVRDEIYFHLPNGVGNSKMMPFVARRLGDAVTVRNWKTVTKMYELSGGA